jgi:hypothetical protein
VTTPDELAPLLGREPRGPMEVVLRDEGGAPVVIRNGPVLDDGTPMPTRYWLVGKAAKLAVDRLEAAGGVDAAEAAVDPDELASAHQRYAQERDAAIDPAWTGPRPAGGVGGTRRGVKCLHAHVAWYLVGGDDPVGRWVAGQLWGGPRPDGPRPDGPPSDELRPSVLPSDELRPSGLPSD